MKSYDFREPSKYHNNARLYIVFYNCKRLLYVHEAISKTRCSLIKQRKIENCNNKKAYQLCQIEVN